MLRFMEEMHSHEHSEVDSTFYVSWATHIGARKNQEDRFVCLPDLLRDGGSLAFFGVFDGTVKEHASEWVHRNITACLLESDAFRRYQALAAEARTSDAGHDLLEKAVFEMYASCDARLLAHFKEHKIDYSACTSVTALIHTPTDTLFCAHLGDSHLSVGNTRLTVSHKPNDEAELQRIESAGGSLTYLHGGKPFIRGGDFHNRNHAMQLNYSRAFGGKDLKMYGLSALPDVRRWKLNNSLAELLPATEPPLDGYDEVIVLGSDGLWDVMDSWSISLLCARVQRFWVDYHKAKHARATAAAAAASSSSSSSSDAKDKDKEGAKAGDEPEVPNCGLSVAEFLVHTALEKHEQVGCNDNVTCIVIFRKSKTNSLPFIVKTKS